MNRRDFVKFMGVGSASIAASTALANMPEVEPKIILLDKPKDIIISKDLPDVDFVINEAISINYKNNENMQAYESLGFNTRTYSPGSKDVEVDVEYHVIKDDINLFKRHIKPSTFTFNLSLENTQYAHLMELNGRKFILSEYRVSSSAASLIPVELSGIEVLL